MPLAHYINAGPVADTIYEPLFKSLFEVMIELPSTLTSPDFGGDFTSKILLRNTTSVQLPTYPKIDVKPQRFKYSTRLYPTLPGTTSIQDLTIKFNLNESAGIEGGYTVGKVPVFRAMKDWYDLLWNNETGQLHYKKNLIGTITADHHDKEGLVIRRVIWHNAFITAFTGWEDLNWESTGDIFDLSATFAADYWEDYYY